MSTGPREDLLVWIDLEMTGLDPARDVILEIATIVTTNDLDVVEEGPNFILHWPDDVLDKMIGVVREMHERNGLTALARASSVEPQEAQTRTLEFLERHCVPKTAPLCGNSIWTDRMFLNRQMPTIDGFLHHRVIDVSSLKELSRRWHSPIAAAAPPKPECHRARDDIRASLAELRYYREQLLRPAGP